MHGRVGCSLERGDSLAAVGHVTWSVRTDSRSQTTWATLALVSDHEEALEALRLAAQPDRSAPAAMEPYLEKVRGGAYRVTDGDVNELRAAGFSEDEIFEQTVSAAVSEGLVRLDAALRAVG